MDSKSLNPKEHLEKCLIIILKMEILYLEIRNDILKMDLVKMNYNKLQNLKSEIYNYLLNYQITNDEKLYLFDLLDGILLEENYELGSYVIKNKMSVR